MVSSEFAQIMSLHAGEAYAMQNLTRTDRLGLLISGKVRRPLSQILTFDLFPLKLLAKTIFRIPPRICNYPLHLSD